MNTLLMWQIAIPISLIPFEMTTDYVRQINVTKFYNVLCTVATVESPVLQSMDAMNHSSSGELGLMQASKFGFMIETCILAARNDECLVCPAHKEHPLTIRDIAPDLVRNFQQILSDM